MRNYLLHRALKKNTESTKYQGFLKLKTVLLVYDAEETETRKDVEQLRKALTDAGKQVTLFCYRSGKKPKENVPKNTYFTADVNMLKKPTNRVVANIPNVVDVLIDWTKATVSPNDFLAATTKATLKIGINKNLPCFALAIQDRGNPKEKVIEEVMKYLKLINHG